MKEILTRDKITDTMRLLQTYMFARMHDWDENDRVNVAAGLGDLARLIENDKKLHSNESNISIR